MNPLPRDYSGVLTTHWISNQNENKESHKRGLLTRSGFALFAVVAILYGAFIVLGSISITIAKIIYFLVLLALALYVLTSTKNVHERELINKCIILTFLFLVTAGCLWVSSASFGIEFNRVINNSLFITIILASMWFITIPVLMSRIDLRVIMLLISIAALYSSFSIFYKWSQKRGWTNFNTSRIGLDNDWVFYLSLMFFILLTLNIKIWIKVSFLLIILISTFFLLYSGNRTNILAITILLFLGALHNRNSFRKVLLITFLGFVFFMISISRIATSSRIADRYSDLLDGISIGVRNLDADTLLQFDSTSMARFIQRNYAIEQWREHPWRGTGVDKWSMLIIDSPIGTFARLGIFGTSLLFIILYLTWFKFRNIPNLRAPWRSALSRLMLLLTSAMSFANDWASSKSFWLSQAILFGVLMHENSNDLPEVRQENG